MAISVSMSSCTRYCFYSSGWIRGLGSRLAHQEDLDQQYQQAKSGDQRGLDRALTRCCRYSYPLDAFQMSSFTSSIVQLLSMVPASRTAFFFLVTVFKST